MLVDLGCQSSHSCWESGIKRTDTILSPSVNKACWHPRGD